jgi:Protein of unknown function (DUF4058)
MPSPFPGMDPYLEDPGLWSNVHNTLIAGYRDQLAAQLRPKYFVGLEERVYVTDESDERFKQQLRIPDVVVASRTDWEETTLLPSGDASQVEVAEPVVAITWFEKEIHDVFLEIIDVKSHDVIAVIEVLSPSNKVPDSPGRESFEDKRREVMRSRSHWVEIDLLRGNRMVSVPKKVGPHSYLVHISKRGQRPRGLLYAIRLSQRLPVIPIPLKPGDPDARLDMQTVLDEAYDRAGYDLRIDYRADPNPPLSGKLATWADQLLRSKERR